MRTENRTETHLYAGGVQYIYAFPNGVRASVICNDYSYGGKMGLWEVAELGTGETLADEPEGFLTETEVDDLLERYAARDTEPAQTPSVESVTEAIADHLDGAELFDDFDLYVDVRDAGVLVSLNDTATNETVRRFRVSVSEVTD